MTADTVFWTAAGAGSRRSVRLSSPSSCAIRCATRPTTSSPGSRSWPRATRRSASLAGELRRRDEAGELVPRIADFAWALVHMHANRLLHASQRAQELVLYDFLRRLHAWQTKAKPK